jgi:hypothetical protein
MSRSAGRLPFHAALWLQARALAPQVAHGPVQEQRESRQRRLRAIISGLYPLRTAPDAERQELRVQVAQLHRQGWQLQAAGLSASAGKLLLYMQ